MMRYLQKRFTTVIFLVAVVGSVLLMAYSQDAEALTTLDVPREGRAIIFTKEDMKGLYFICEESISAAHECQMVHTSNMRPVICYIDNQEHKVGCVPMQPESQAKKESSNAPKEES